MRVVVLGAGASFGSSHWQVARAPLVDRFFSVADDHGLLDTAFAEGHMEDLKGEVARTGGDWSVLERFMGGPLEGHLAALKSFVHEQLGVPPDNLSTAPVNIERLFGLIEAELLGRVGYDLLRGAPPTTSPPDVLEQQLYLVICGTLIASTNDVRCDYHRALAAWLEPGDVLISFNYDLLADRALADRGDWWINDGYGLQFHRVGRWSGDSGEWRVPLDTDSRIRLLKPHGSLNWLYCRDPRESVHHISLRGGKERPAPPILYCLEDMHGDFPDDFPLFEWWARYEHDDDDGYSFDLHSLIVPPSITKQYRNFEPLIGSTWATALDILLNAATELYFVGYSLRPEDLRSWWLFRKAAEEAARLEDIMVVDPSEDVLARVAEAFAGRRVVHAANTLADVVGNL
jgi:hypothetical protein